MTNTFFAFLDS